MHEVGNIEEGWFRDGLLDGKGREILTNLDTLEGNFLQGRLHGEG